MASGEVLQVTVSRVRRQPLPPWLRTEVRTV